MLLVFFTWPRSATVSHSVALCQQCVRRHVALNLKKKRRRRGKISYENETVAGRQITSLLQFSVARRQKQKRGEKEKNEDNQSKRREGKNGK